MEGLEGWAFWGIFGVGLKGHQMKNSPSFPETVGSPSLRHTHVFSRITLLLQNLGETKL